MSKQVTHTVLSVMPLIAVLSVNAALAGEAASTDGLLACEFRTGAANGMTTIEGVVHATDAVEGSYRLFVDGGGATGSARINQAGAFYATPNAPVTLGHVMLDSGGTYDARLEVSSAGSTVICEELIGGPIGPSKL
ncbi:curli-like amyloid fiber formation chaperone CsgH [Nitratireductor luteus]|uniref:curli-like amyloid fiber formation chaperone CsgH n=1 Tax=Nitratireductor luteus TaxID=2976980 RepID=UPI00223FABD8|nr:curli-like amyloid fiber formation chaperone CsgH [Nitratireductor luteus]